MNSTDVGSASSVNSADVWFCIFGVRRRFCIFGVFCRRRFCIFDVRVGSASSVNSADIALLLYIAQCLIQILWRLKIDPDNSAIPLLTALGDLSGVTCLTIAFYIHRAVV
ncbi:solute carrier family 41 member 2 [Caerostris extrusa]|uniref:Solute carrier family 41 member 2 n=1 Tax=Caerostris extrusa TaxID=172846 RepID=A0AAV4VMW1_CAEEX|nr:solute carrier family 41 member 2 [Caerostris extrusa]